MSRICALLVLCCPFVFAGDGPRELEWEMRQGERYTGSTTVEFEQAITTRQGLKETTVRSSVQRTERFLDTVRRATDTTGVEIERTYLRLYTKTQGADDERPTVFRHPFTGRTAILTDRGRRRELRSESGDDVDAFLRRVAGMEMDWRDILPQEPVQPGDAWDADASSLAQRLACYLDTGTRTQMRVRYEEDVERDGARCAKFYVEWSVEGMRDRHLFAKAVLGGDVLYDFARKRVTVVDLGGRLTVQGAIVGDGEPKIIKGTGRLTVRTTIKPAAVDAAADSDEHAD